MNSYEHMTPTTPSKYVYLGDGYDFRAIISLSLLVGRRDRQRIDGSVNHIVLRIEDDINFIVGLLCHYESPCTHMGTISLRKRKMCLPGRIDVYQRHGYL